MWYIPIVGDLTGWEEGAHSPFEKPEAKPAPRKPGKDAITRLFTVSERQTNRCQQYPLLAYEVIK